MVRESSSGKSRFAAWTIALVVALAGPGLDATQSSPNLVVVKRLIDAAFPELRTRTPRVKVTIDAAFDRPYDAGPIGIAIDGPVASDGEAPFLHGHILLSAGSIEQAAFEGTHLSSPEMARVTTLAKGHPAWTEADLDRALRDAGAKFPPSAKSSFVGSLHVDRFSDVLGRIRKSDVTFWWRLGKAELEADDIVTPSWVVRVETAGTGHGPRCYVLLFEPIGGRFRSLVQAQSPPPCASPLP